MLFNIYIYIIILLELFNTSQVLQAQQSAESCRILLLGLGLITKAGDRGGQKKDRGGQKNKNLIIGGFLFRSLISNSKKS